MLSDRSLSYLLVYIKLQRVFLPHTITSLLITWVLNLPREMWHSRIFPHLFYALPLFILCYYYCLLHYSTFIFWHFSPILLFMFHFSIWDIFSTLLLCCVLEFSYISPFTLSIFFYHIIRLSTLSSFSRVYLAIIYFIIHNTSSEGTKIDPCRPSVYFSMHSHTHPSCRLRGLCFLCVFHSSWLSHGF